MTRSEAIVHQLTALSGILICATWIAINSVVNPAKVGHLGRVGDVRAMLRDGGGRSR